MSRNTLQTSGGTLAAAPLKYAIVDVFSTTAFKGNPLAVVDDTSRTLSDTQMRLIARQFNLSETTFFSINHDPSSHPSGAHVGLRSFLPDGKEVFGSGHNILGVWWYLAQHALLAQDKPVRTSPSGEEEFVFRQELGGVVSPVRILRTKKAGGGDEVVVSVQQAPPKPHAEHPDVHGLAKSVGLSPDDIGFSRGSGTISKPQVMSTASTRHLLVPVASLEALDRVVVQRGALLEQLAAVDEQAYGIYLFTPVGGHKNTYRARFFSPGMSSEDPATGSAAGPLSRYLFDHGGLELVPGDNSGEKKGVIRVEQGHRLGRECVIDVQLCLADGSENADVAVVGGGVKVAEGEMLRPGESLEF